MNHQVLARKFRPNQFQDVMGQEEICTTLTNAIKANRLAHAYLFSGPRGVGKTTTARLLAKALNCQEGPTDQPCGECSFCREIADGISLDVLEVDGASNNGVEQVRSLIETVKYNSASNKYKIYIIDEVHMLTISAFNALLKTLEEPPPRVIFIFATTELEKVPETIQSRCQQFQFHLIPREIIMKRLKALILKEGFQSEEGVYSLVAHASGGSMRDAESILEKVMTFCGSPLTEKGTLNALGMVPRDLFYQLAESIFMKKPLHCLEIIQKVSSEGRNLNKFIQESIHFFRNLLFIKCAGETLIKNDHGQEDLNQLKNLSKKFEKESQLLHILDLLCNLETEMKSSLSPQVLAEVTFVKLSHSSQSVPLDALLMKLIDIENRLKKEKDQNHKKEKPEERPISNNKNKPESNSNRDDLLKEPFVKNACEIFEGKVNS
jgi:DNA polymerase III subunit gamma/tau